MGNWEIILTVFGSGATIIIVLIVIFKWMGIQFFNCCMNKSNFYKVEDTSNQKISNFRNYDSNKPPPFGFNQSLSGIFRNKEVSIETTETFDFSNICMGDSNGDSLITHLRPALQHTIPCNLDPSNESYIEIISSNTRTSCGKLETEINFNPFEELLEVKVLQLKDLRFNYIKKMNSNDSKNKISAQIGPSNQVKNFNEQVDTLANFQAYLLVWLNDNFLSNQRSKLICLSNTSELNTEFKWMVDDNSLMQNKVNIQIYMIDLKNKIEFVFAQSSIKIGEIYMNHPISFWLTLHDPEEIPALTGEVLISLSYLPTAERLTAIVVEARNLQFTNNSIFGDSFVKISLIKSNGSIIESYKTRLRKNDPNPQFNEVSVFKVSTKNLNSLFLKVAVYEWIDNKESEIGHFYIGPQKNDLEISHWKQMLRLVRRQVSIWHSIEKTA